MPRCDSAPTAGADTISQSFLQNVTLTRNATMTPISARRMRVLSSSKCSMKDMRSMPLSSSSPSSSSPGGGGGAGRWRNPLCRRLHGRTGNRVNCELLRCGRFGDSCAYRRFGIGAVRIRRTAVGRRAWAGFIISSVRPSRTVRVERTFVSGLWLFLLPSAILPFGVPCSSNWSAINPQQLLRILLFRSEGSRVDRLKSV